jgi:glycosyltransferase involved in cell wall biosynthesis
MWYMLDEMLDLFARIKIQYPGAIFLFITPEPADSILGPANKFNLSPSDFVIRSANRKEVPLFTAASDINLFFIKQSYSKIASSPTKLGEILAMGLPVICNTRVGDVEEIVRKADAGITIEDFNAGSYNNVVNIIPALLKKDSAEIRKNAVEYYTLDNAISKYAGVYSRLIS